MATSGNKPRAAADAHAPIFRWPTEAPPCWMCKSETQTAFEQRVPFNAGTLTFTIRPMEARRHCQVRGIYSAGLSGHAYAAVDSSNKEHYYY